MKFIFIIIISCVIINTQLFSQNEISTETITDDLFSPWELLEAPDGWLWYTERLGTIWKLNPDTGEKKRIGVIDSVYNNFERGLLGMELHPNFPEKPWVYMVYTTQINENEYYNRLIRMEYKNDTLTNYQRFIQTRGNYAHNGSRLKFSPDGFLFMTMGEVAEHNRAQSLNEWEGKIYRMDENCNPLNTNPYYFHGGEPAKYIYSYAHRNPQGLVFAKGKIYSSEHGPDTDDELNIIQYGRNYGWPRVKGFCDEEEEMNYCDENQVVEPIYAWTPTVAVSGIDYYSGDRFPEFENSILQVTLKNATLHVLKLNASGEKVLSEEEYFADQFGRLRDILVTSDDRIFMITANGDWHQNDNNFRNDKLIEIKSDINTVQRDNIYLDAYPNPSSDIINIELDSHLSSKIVIFDYLGNQVYSISKRDRKLRLDIKDFTNGIYYIQVETETGEILKEKFIKN